MLWFLVLLLEVTLVVGYLTVTETSLTSVPELIYSWIWINVGAYAAIKTEVNCEDRRRKIAVGVLSAIYFLFIMWISGFVGLASTASGLNVTWTVPAWGPIVTFADVVYIKILPFMAFGYLALSYLLYAAVLDASGAVAGGVLGLVSCVGCTWPVFAAVAGVFAGGVGGLSSAVYAAPYGLSTAVFVASVLVLYKRPFV